jgi:hypothetical protein
LISISDFCPYDRANLPQALVDVVSFNSAVGRLRFAKIAGSAALPIREQQDRAEATGE